MSWSDAVLSPRLDTAAEARPVAGARSVGRGRLIAWTREVLGPVLAGAAMLMAVTVLNGRPTVFTDTDDYFSQGKDVVRAAGLWLTQGKPPINPAEIDDRLHDPGDQDEEPVHNQNGARSVYYGLFVYSFERWGTLWALAAAQATVAASVVYALWRQVAPGAPSSSYLRVMGALALGSSLPVFTGFAMPDLFAGFSAVATVLVTLYADRFGRWGKVALWLLLAACLNFHGSNLLTSLGLTVLALGWLGLRKRVGWRPLAGRLTTVLSAAAVAVMASKAYGVAIKLRTGDDLGRPPFLTARVLADGPGREYLRWSCAHGGKWALCPYAHDPLDNTEDILWSDDPATGIFNSADYHTRVKLEREERAFVFHAVAYDPLREVAAMLRNWGLQLVSVSYEEPLRDPAYYLTDDYWKTTTLRPLLLRERRCDPERGGCILHLPAGTLSEVDEAFAIAALVWMAWTLLSPFPLADGGRAREGGVATALKETLLSRRRLAGPTFNAGASAPHPTLPPSRGKGSEAAAVLLVLAVAINAAVCGMLSGPFDRYEARLLWLVPCAALLLHEARRRPS
jgi:hypothetical protein